MASARSITRLLDGEPRRAVVSSASPLLAITLLLTSGSLLLPVPKMNG